jgi:hypothetical protein
MDIYRTYLEALTVEQQETLLGLYRKIARVGQACPFFEAIVRTPSNSLKSYIGSRTTCPAKGSSER